jgi:hypothetical protein
MFNLVWRRWYKTPFVVDIIWKYGQLIEARILSRADGECVVKAAGQPIKVQTGQGCPVDFMQESGRLRFQAKGWTTYVLCFSDKKEAE